MPALSARQKQVKAQRAKIMAAPKPEQPMTLEPQPPSKAMPLKRPLALVIESDHELDAAHATDPCPLPRKAVPARFTPRPRFVLTWATVQPPIVGISVGNTPSVRKCARPQSQQQTIYRLAFIPQTHAPSAAPPLPTNTKSARPHRDRLQVARRLVTESEKAELLKVAGAARSAVRAYECQDHGKYQADRGHACRRRLPVRPASLARWSRKQASTDAYQTSRRAGRVKKEFASFLTTGKPIKLKSGGDRSKQSWLLTQDDKLQQM
ncbi:hypothetical protein BCR44DRAFT_1511397 [Catenaria anguillulae PL171]|uniref:Uncharacterized protein n=1 Tax=Catenaria anguillulae PL171 TaxID=765915 RepID=A0A1Y2HU42_9FUNG|nr:hypothetical protein BCR44DRAFT_1511397 [Catenaria anguillulae PL171]